MRTLITFVLTVLLCGLTATGQTNTPVLPVQYLPSTVANLPSLSPAPTPGSTVWITDGNVGTIPCTAGGAGAYGVWTGTQWGCVTFVATGTGGGTVTQINTTFPIAGGPIVSSGTVQCGFCLYGQTPVAHGPMFGLGTQALSGSSAGLFGQPLLSNGPSNNGAYGSINLAGGSNIVTGILPNTNLPTATAVALGIVKPDGLTINVNGSGVLSAAAGIGGGTVTVVSNGSLASSAILTGGGSTSAQTPSTTSTMDANGNVSLSGSLVVGNGSTASSFVALPRGTAHASLGTPSNPTVVWCSDCTVSSCGTSGSGAWAFYNTGSSAWSCPF